MISQTINWDTSDFVGYSEEQLKLIRVGFMHALNKVYKAEKTIEDNGHECLTRVD